ncbi:hypothetical protein ABPG75_005638 [Micractinium tetrahymenae]
MVHGPHGENWVLTNAHAVDYATNIQLKKRWDKRRWDAKVLAIGRDPDIALLTVEDPGFWEGAAFATFGELPSARDSVTVVGFPLGGDTISATAGIVSRIEVVPYSFSSRALLALQIDAAINPGNSGGPVLNDRGECVGLAFQAIVPSEAQSVGYVVPTPVIFHFLDDIKTNGTFTGFPSLGVQTQRMEADALQQAYKVPVGQGGVLVRKVYPVGSAAGQLQEGDVLQRFDGTEIAPDGTVPFRTSERISMTHIITMKFVGENATLDVLRNGEPAQLNVTMKPPSPLVPFHLEGEDPPYLIVGGLLFDVLSVPYLFSEYGQDYPTKAPVGLLEQLRFGVKNTSDEQVVVLNRVLSSDATTGYEDFSNIQSDNVQLLRFQGKPVVSLAQLAAAVADAAKDEFMTFGMDQDEVIVLESSVVPNGTAEVLQAHAIPSPMSRDLLESLGAQPPVQAADKAAAP